MNRIKIEKIIRSILFVVIVSILIIVNKNINVMADDTEEDTPEECFTYVKDFDYNCGIGCIQEFL